MKVFSRRTWFVFGLALLGGVLLHFLYGWFPNPVTAIFSPVRESLWEHIKILYWPYLAAMWYLTRDGRRGCRAPWLLALLVMCGGMLAVAWWYHFKLGGERLIFDLGLYFVSMAAGFLMPRIFRGLAGKGWWCEGLWVMVALLGAAILLFTSLTPVGAIFTDLSAVHTWWTIPF